MSLPGGAPRPSTEFPEWDPGSDRSHDGAARLAVPAADDATAPPGAPDAGVATVVVEEVPAPPPPTAAQGRATRGWRRWLPVGVLGFGLVVLLFLAYLFAGSALVHGRAQRALLPQLRTAIEVGPPQPEILADGVAALPPPLERGTPVALLRIPSLELSQVVVEGSRSADLTAGPGHVPASPLPGEPGTSVVAGRRTTYGGPFRGLDRLEAGDEVLATTPLGTFTYEVTEVVVVEPGEPDRLSAGAPAGLTLVTSDPPGIASSRLSVLAELQGDPLAPVRGRERGLDDADLGLAGEAVALAPLLLWSQLLLLACVGTAWLYGRWSRRSAYLLTTPVVAALLLLSFESLQRLLPSTL